jgi:uncharacterized protein
MRSSQRVTRRRTRSKWALKMRLSFALLSAVVSARAAACPEASRASLPVSLLVVTGGHPYDPMEFFTALGTMRGIKIEDLLTIDGKPASYPLGGLKRYDAVLLYDMEPGAVSPEWQSILGHGRGYVFLHHAIWSFPESSRFAEILGGHAIANSDQSLQGSKVHAPIIQHYHIVDKLHPVTCGIRNFTILDEVYDDFHVDTSVHFLLESDGPRVNKSVAWTWAIDGHRVVYLEPGHGNLGLPENHGPTAYQNSEFMRLLQRAILWAAGRI